MSDLFVRGSKATIETLPEGAERKAALFVGEIAHREGYTSSETREILDMLGITVTQDGGLTRKQEQEKGMTEKRPTDVANEPVDVSEDDEIVDTGVLYEDEGTQEEEK